METDFPLRSVTVDDTGNYSCVYYQKRAPFHASAPSDLIEIWVTGKVFTVRRTTAELPATWSISEGGGSVPTKLWSVGGKKSLSNKEIRARTMW